MPAPGQGIRVISFDGPMLDATGLSELLILEDIAGKWAWDHEDDREGGDVRASEICDIVGGTGIGGFYAILFSLNLTVSQVITSHKILQNVVFSSDEWERKDTDGCTVILRKALGQMVEDVGLAIDLDGPFLSNDSLKCYVCILDDLHVGCARSLRNYRVRSSKSPRCSIREAIYATLADGVHLPPTRVQDEQFVSALSGFANPSYELMKELPAAFPKGSKLACFVNLGAGCPLPLSVPPSGSQEEQSRRVQYAEAVAQNLIALCGGLGTCYFRLSVTTKSRVLTPKSTDEVLRIVKSLTVGYLEEAEIGLHLDALVDALAQRHGVVLLKRLGSLAAEDGKAMLNAQIEVVHDHVVHMKKTMDDEFYCKMKSWLTPIDQTAKLDSCIRTRTSSTCGWLWDSPRVVEWKKNGGIFWCHAGMGTGKTIIMSYVVETLIKVPAESFVAYYYFEFTSPSTLSEEALFRSLVFQLSHANYTASRRLYEQHRNGSLQPQLTTLLESLREIVTRAPLPVYIIIDALDELPLPQRKYLIESLLTFSSLSANGIHIMATSRDEVDIHKAFSGKVSFDFAIEKEVVHNDIAVFVDQALSAEKWTFWPKHEILNMRNILINKAAGMFRMVACQLEVLNQTQSTEDMERALASLPATLGDTYQYILHTIPSHLQSRAHTFLCILSTAVDLVSIAELSALVAVELGDPADPNNLPVYRERMLFHEPQNLIGLGAALVCRTTIYPKRWKEESKESLQLSHASVKEYLLQGSCLWYSLNDQLANETAARACLALLIHNEDPKRTSGDVQITYTRNNWRRHIPSNHSVQLLSQQKKLFETFPWPHTSAGKWLYYKRRLNYGDSSLERPPKLKYFLKSPLTFAAAASLEQLFLTMLELSFRWKIEDLNEAIVAASQMKSSTEVLVENGADVNMVGRTYGSALQAAASQNALDVVQLLINNGADVNRAGGCYGSALHAAVHAAAHASTHPGALDIVQLLVKNVADANMMGGKHGPALHEAALVEALDVVEFLVANGADVNIVGGKHGSALQLAASQNALDVVQLLVKNGADINMAGGDYGSALHAAAHAGALDIVQLLVESGADANMMGGKYGSALHEAALVGALDVVKFLVANGADVNMVGGKHGSALQLAASQNALDVVQLLVMNGADVNMEGGDYGSALHAAAHAGIHAGALDIVQLLVENGADVNMMGGKYGSALHEAAFVGALDIVKVLVANGADVNIAGGDYGSALHVAVFSGDLDVIQLLVEHGAEVNMMDRVFGSVLEVAKHNFRASSARLNTQKIVTFLIEHGAVRSDGTIPIIEELKSEELESEDSSIEYYSDTSWSTQ
ncbi:hypothetical protein DL96DRAFT_1688769 [Flagelloscypha sp. PMI_526]|nr:hypothetical protein DL96DRAFT_1688769 [Flagelloscypha sp. PMI_526]